MKDFNYDQLPGFSEQTIVKNIDSSSASDFSMVDVLSIQKYVPQNTLTSGAVTVRVAEIECISNDVKLSKVQSFILPRYFGYLVKIVKYLSEMLIGPGVISYSDRHLIDIVNSADSDKYKLPDVLSRLESSVSFMEGSNNTENENGKIKICSYLVRYNYEMTRSSLDRRVEFQMQADRSLSAHIIEALNEEMLSQYPLILSEQPCGALSQIKPNSFMGVILSRTYSSNPMKTKMHLEKVIGNCGFSHYTSDIVKAMCLGIVKGDNYPFVKYEQNHIIGGTTYFISRKDPLKIVHCQDKEEYALHRRNDCSPEGYRSVGYYSREYNVIAFLADDMDDNTLGTFIHESAHAIMNILFKNKSKPYSSENAEQLNAYKLAELNVFRNVAEKLGFPAKELSSVDNVADIIKWLKDDIAIFSKHKNDKVLSAFSILVRAYEESELDCEVIVRIPQFLSMGIPLSNLQTYFMPLLNYWDKIITPKFSAFFDESRELFKRLNLDPDANMDSLLSAFSTFTLDPCKGNASLNAAEGSCATQRDKKERIVERTIVENGTDIPDDDFVRSPFGCSIMKRMMHHGVKVFPQFIKSEECRRPKFK